MWLFEQTGLQSSTIGFTWDTSFLMGKILRFAGEAETFEEFVNAVKYFRQCCYEFLEPYLTKIFEKVKANPEWVA